MVTVQLPDELPQSLSNRRVAHEWRWVSRASSELLRPAGAHGRTQHELMYDMEETCVVTRRRNMCTNEYDRGESTVRNLTGMN